jgi:hypothetical protein
LNDLVGGHGSLERVASLMVGLFQVAHDATSSRPRRRHGIGGIEGFS